MDDIIKINKKTGKKYIPCYDLHGYTTKEAYIEVKEVILECFKLKINSINFVTGRGNHPNVNGERGVLFKKFKEWLEDDEIINLVKNYVVGDGSYKVYLYKKKRKINKKTIKIDIKNGSIKRNNVLLLKEEPIFDKNETNKQLILIKEEIDKLLNRKELNLSLTNRKEELNLPLKESNSYTISSLNYDYVKTIYNLGRTLLKRNKKKIGIGLIQEAAENGYEEAKRYLGEAYIEGRVIRQDYKKSFEWILNAYNNNFEIEFYIAFLYKFGVGCKQDYIRSLYWFHRSAKNNHPEAQFYLGNLYINLDRKEALKWYTISAENGQANAQYILGKAYEMGLLGLDKNKSKSLMWYIKSAEQGHLLAKTKIDIQSETS